MRSREGVAPFRRDGDARGTGRKILSALLAASLSGLLVGTLASTAEATHFRYGHITWQPGPPGSPPNTIEFRFNAVFRDGYGAGNTPGNCFMETIGASSLNFGDGSPSTGTLRFLSILHDDPNNFVEAVMDEQGACGAGDGTGIVHTYAAPGNYTAFVSSCCRISSCLSPNGHLNNPDDPYRLETLVNVGTGNRSPVSTLPFIVNVLQNPVAQPVTFSVPASDPDGDPLRFRLATAAEMGVGTIHPGPPQAPNAAAIGNVTGVYSWDNSGALRASGLCTRTLYSTQVVIEDLDSLGAVKSKVPLDFFISLVDCPANNTAPHFDPPTPPCGSGFKITTGQSLTFDVVASDSDVGPVQNVQLSAAGLPPGASMSPTLPTSGNPVSSTFSWAPAPGQTGIFVIVFTATDDCGAQTLCDFTITVDSFNVIAEFRGSTVGGLAGWAVSSAGDLDGDGRNDYLVGAPGVGQAYAVSGANGSVLRTFTGTSVGDQFGCAVLNAGDLDGDGVNDVVVGARDAAIGGVGNAGQVRAFSGSSGAVLHTFDGADRGDAFGCALAAGDLDADAVPDLLVGAPLASPGGIEAAGQVKAFSGASGAVLHTFDGTAAYQNLGASVAIVGDVNGDLVPDLVLGSPGTSQAYVRSGADGSVLYTVNGTTSADRLGASVAAAGDADHDGTPDFVVGAPLANPFGLLDAGEARLFSGSTGSLLHLYTGIAQHEHFGASVAGVGDVDQDGTPDVFVGASGSDQARVFSGWTGFVLLALKGDVYGEGFGSAVAGAGDVDGDGVPDLLVGAYAADPCGAIEAGQVEVFSFNEVPPGSISGYGHGSAGTGGFVPMIGAMGGAPAAGNASFAVTVSKALGGTNALLFLGTSSTTWNGVPLPLNLGFLGMPSASLFAAPHFSFATVTCGSGGGVGLASSTMALPADPSVSGSELFFQWYVVDPGPAAFPGATSDALRILIQ